VKPVKLFKRLGAATAAGLIAVGIAAGAATAGPANSSEITANPGNSSEITANPGNSSEITSTQFTIQGNSSEIT
jgi:hypothetical protein